MAGGTGYPLSTTHEHLRRRNASTLLFAMAKRALQLEQSGGSLEFFTGCLSGDGDYVAFFGIDFAEKVRTA